MATSDITKPHPTSSIETQPTESSMFPPNVLLMSRIDHERLGTFFGVLVALAVVFEVGLCITSTDPNSARVVYMFTPMVAGLAVVYRSEYSLSDFGVRVGQPLWLGGAVLAGLLLVGLTILVSMGLPGIHLDLMAVKERPVPSGLLGVGILILSTVLSAVTVGVVTGFGEEFGWRGYLLWELAPLGFWRASVVIGAVWGVWHVPGIVQGMQYESFPYVGIFVFTAATIALSPVYTYVVWRSKSVVGAAFLHGVFNSASFTVNAVLVADSKLLGQLVATTIGIAGIVACVLVWGLLYIRGTPSLDRETLDRSSSNPVTSQTMTAD